MKKYFVTLKISLIVIITALSNGLKASEEIFIVSYGSHKDPPYTIVENNKLVGGIIKDIIDEIAEELDILVQYTAVPRKREDKYILNDKVHAIVLSNPAWLANSDKLQWTHSLFVEKNVLVVAEDSEVTIDQLADIKGLTIGTIRGYVYPSLAPYFDNKEAIRSDVSTNNLNFVRLDKGWIDAFIDSDILVNYFLKYADNSNDFKIANVIISEHKIHTALSPNAPISKEQFNQALVNMKKYGVIDSILKKYKIQTVIPMNE